MSTISSLFQSSQADLAAASKKTGAADQLGQQDFLKLMTAQLQNQDPFAPMENGEFLAQMAQFSTVAGLDTVNETLSSINGQIGANRIATGASLLGQQVLVPGMIARPDDAGTISGVADLPARVSGLTVTYTDAETGMVLKTQELGPQPKGLVGFSWENVPTSLQERHGAVRVSLKPANDVTDPVGTFVYARVVGVSLPQNSSDMTLDVEDYGPTNSQNVTALR